MRTRSTQTSTLAHSTKRRRASTQVGHGVATRARSLPAVCCVLDQVAGARLLRTKPPPRASFIYGRRQRRAGQLGGGPRQSCSRPRAETWSTAAGDAPRRAPGGDAASAGRAGGCSIPSPEAAGGDNAAAAAAAAAAADAADAADDAGCRFGVEIELN
eukprot:scaffold2134_cov384-Prasinococcus_capsulatus_cf.AAC.17